MSDVIIKFKLLRNGALIPKFAHEGDACSDIYSEANVTLAPGSRKLIPTGFSMEIPIGWEAQIRPRSGLALKKGVAVLNSPGTIDSGYRGEVQIILANLGDVDFEVKKGDRVAQMAIRKVPSVIFEIVENLEDSERGKGGFGSTGVRN